MKDKAKHTAALIQEITEELQAIEEESTKEEQDLDATQLSDLEQEDSDIPLMEDEQSLSSGDSIEKAYIHNNSHDFEDIKPGYKTLHTEESYHRYRTRNIFSY